MVFLAGIGSEHEQTGKIMYPGDLDAQCRYAYRKLKKVLAHNGAGMADVVKQVTYVIDARHQQAAGECRRQAYGKAPLPAHTFLNVSQLAWPAMLVEIDVIAMVPLR
jgi:enamine deaminase RidA (YjgF/YER057c/UK114 family)